MKFPDRETVERLRRDFPAGTRVVLLKMETPRRRLRGLSARFGGLTIWEDSCLLEQRRQPGGCFRGGRVPGCE